MTVRVLASRKTLDAVSRIVGSRPVSLEPAEMRFQDYAGSCYLNDPGNPKHQDFAPYVTYWADYDLPGTDQMHPKELIGHGLHVVNPGLLMSPVHHRISLGESIPRPTFGTIEPVVKGKSTGKAKVKPPALPELPTMTNTAFVDEERKRKVDPPAAPSPVVSVREAKAKRDAKAESERKTKALELLKAQEQERQAAKGKAKAKPKPAPVAARPEDDEPLPSLADIFREIVGLPR